MIFGLMMVRKGSKRLPDKCLLPFNGSTLFEYSLDKNGKLKLLDLLYVVSNDERIEAICDKKPYGTFVQEPEELANQDNSWKVIKWFIQEGMLFSHDVVIYLPPTAPLRSNDDVKAAYDLFKENQENAEALVSVCECTEPPQWSFYLDDNYLHLHDFPLTSQELRAHYYLNGAIYIGKVENLLKNNGFFSLKTMVYIMPKERSVDIDYQHEFDYAEFLALNEEAKKLKAGEGTGKWIS